MRLLFVFGYLFFLSVNAQDDPTVQNDITVEYAKVIKVQKANELTLSLCNVKYGVNDVDATTDAELIIQSGDNDVEIEDLKGSYDDTSKCLTFASKTALEDTQYKIYLEITEITEQKAPTIKHEFTGLITFKESNAEPVVSKIYNTVNIIQFTGGNVPVFKYKKQNDESIIIQTPTCNNNVCIHKLTETIDTAVPVAIYNTESDTIPIAAPKEATLDNDECSGDFTITAVYETNGFKFDGATTNLWVVSGNEAKFDFTTNIIPPEGNPKEFVLIQNNLCEKISAKFRDMTFLEPFTDTVEVSWAKDGGAKFFLEVTTKGGVTPVFSKNLHIDCSQGDLVTCIAYIFSAELKDKQLDYLLSESDESEPNKPTAGKSKTKETYLYPKPDTSKSLKALNLNQFDINWNTKIGKLCVEDALYEKNQKSQFRYELVIGFDNGNWKKHIANYNDESTICFNDFEITQLIENKLGVHFLVMKRDLDTNQILASDMITTDLIVPEISEVNDETISLEFENLNSPFLIRDEKTKNIISKNEKKIHNLAFLKSSHENKSVFNKNLVLETRKEHTQMKVHFKIPQKVNAA